MARWKSLEGQNRERQEVITNPGSFAFDGPAIAALKARVTEGLHLAQAQGNAHTAYTKHSRPQHA